MNGPGQKRGDQLLVARNLHKSYSMGRKSLEVLKGIDLEVRGGEVLIIMGSSGVGKSTLLHLLGGLDVPTSGKVFLDGVDLFALGERERARVRNRKVGFVFQFYHLLPEFTALENVLLPAMIFNDSRRRRTELRMRALELLSDVGLEERTGHKPRELSGGEQQRVAIARALMNRPKIVMADEPSGNLDTETSRRLHELLAGLAREKGQTFLVVTHDPELSGIGNRTVRMIDGRVVEGNGRGGL
ncbi:MAG: ABC transporter ATP-binding protein [Candidatus Tritonobacter lacicola]|nr:ABC transporter ATP-binding protein [Candidatus Tritonobacter lacicola]